MAGLTTRDKSSAQEAFLAKELDARTTPNSGATFRKKGDLLDRWSMFEAKTTMTEKESYSVKKETLKKMRREQYQQLKEFSFLVFDFGKPVAEETYVCMSLEDFKKLYNNYKESLE